MNLVHDFGNGRAIALFGGAYVMVDRLNGEGPDGDGWDLSSEPARPGAELDLLNRLVKALPEGTTVTVTPPEDA